jgi:hypothetical protein
MIHHAVSFVGFMIFAGISWLLSSSRRKIAWRTIAWGVALQLLIGLIIFSLTWFASILTLAERRGTSLTQRVKERFGVHVWTSCGKPRGVRIHWLHPRLPGSSGGNFLCGVHLYVLSPARVADIRPALRQARVATISPASAYEPCWLRLWQR